MCIPVFLGRAERITDPEAYFMFDQASLNSSARENIKRQEFSEFQQGLACRHAGKNPGPRYLDEPPTARGQTLRHRRSSHSNTSALAEPVEAGRAPRPQCCGWCAGRSTSVTVEPDAPIQPFTVTARPITGWAATGGLAVWAASSPIRRSASAAMLSGAWITSRSSAQR